MASQCIVLPSLFFLLLSFLPGCDKILNTLNVFHFTSFDVRFYFCRSYFSLTYVFDRPLCCHYKRIMRVYVILLQFPIFAVEWTCVCPLSTTTNREEWRANEQNFRADKKKNYAYTHLVPFTCHCAKAEPKAQYSHSIVISFYASSSSADASFGSSCSLQVTTDSNNSSWNLSCDIYRTHSSHYPIQFFFKQTKWKVANDEAQTLLANQQCVLVSMDLTHTHQRRPLCWACQFLFFRFVFESPFWPRTNRTLAYKQFKIIKRKKKKREKIENFEISQLTNRFDCVSKERRDINIPSIASLYFVSGPSSERIKIVDVKRRRRLSTLDHFFFPFLAIVRMRKC